MNDKPTETPSDKQAETLPQVAASESQVVTEEALLKLKPVLQPGKEEQARRTLSVLIEERYSGPLPHPSQLEHFERVCPGAADRIISMAEAEQSHRHRQEKSLLNKEFAFKVCGQVGALVAVLAFCGVIAFMASFGPAQAAAAAGLGTVMVAIVAWFVAPHVMAKQAKAGDPAESEPSRSGKRSNRRNGKGKRNGRR